MKNFLFGCTKFAIPFTTGISIGFYDRKNNTFLIRYRNSQEFIKITNNTFTDFYQAFTKKK